MNAFAIIAALASAFCLLPAGFRPALPGYEFAFPRDHGTHDEYRTEWWYYTGHLTTDDGTRYGFELTFFRVGVAAGSGQQAAGSRWEFQDLSHPPSAIAEFA